MSGKSQSDAKLATGEMEKPFQSDIVSANAETYRKTNTLCRLKLSLLSLSLLLLPTRVAIFQKPEINQLNVAES